MAEAPSSPGTIPTRPQIKDITPLNPGEIALRQFVRGSFMVSEGSLGIQKAIFDYAVVKDLLPDLELPRKIPSYMLSLFPPGHHVERSSERIKQDRAFAWNALYESKAKSKGIEPEKLVPVILEELLGRELRYQVRGRPKRGPNSDPHESYLRKFVLLGQSTGSSITDQLCLDLRPALDILRAEPYPSVTDDMVSPVALSPLPQLFQGSGDIIEAMISKRLNAMGNRKILSYIEALWEKRHPGEKFFPESQAA